MNVDRRDYPLFFRMAVSAALLALCFDMLLNHNFPADYTKWAFGMIGIIVGYWLK